MEQLPRLRARIKALGDFHELIRALEAMAATHFRAAQDALQVSNLHLAIVENAHAAMFKGDLIAPPAESDPTQAGAVIALCSDHGFVGGFNDRILDRAQAEMRPNDHLIIVGRRGGQIAAERALEGAQVLKMAAHARSVPDLARRLGLAVIGYPDLRVVHGLHTPGQHQSVQCKSLLQRDSRAQNQVDAADRPLHHLPLPALQSGLEDEHTFAALAHCLLQSLVSENATRLANMQTAEGNVSDKLDNLRQRERVVRQQEITEELLDILTGAQAVQA